MDYYIENYAPVFDVAIYASPDGVTPETLLMTHRLDPDVLPQYFIPDASHSVSFPADFGGDIQEDYYVMAVLDAADEYVDLNEDDNAAAFASGVFLDAPSQIVHAHGNDQSDAVSISQDASALTVGAFSFPFATYNIDAVHIRTHAGDDTMTAGSQVTKTRWQFGGAGNAFSLAA